MNYLLWHYSLAPKFILILIGNYLFFVGHLFSLKLLLRTLFSPWRREIAKKEKPGLNLEDVVNVISFNIISRIIGFVIRLSTLLTALFSFVLVIFLGFILFFLWLFIPILSLPIFLLTKERDDQDKKRKFALSHLEESPKPEDLSHVGAWYERIKLEQQKKKEFWTKENLLSIPGIGRDWAYGYTLLLSKVTTDLAKEPFSLEKLVGRKEQIGSLERVLSKMGNHNVFLLGEPGVGRRTIVIGLAKLIYSGKCLAPLLYKRVLMLDLHLLLSKTQAETEQKLIEILEEARQAGNVILVIPSIDQFVRDEKDHVNLTDVFAEHIEGRDIQIIGITDPYSFQKYILPNQTLRKLFEKVDVSEISIEEALQILENRASELEKKYKVTATYEALVEIIKESEDLITDIPFPEKAIDLLEEALVFVKTKGGGKLLTRDIDEVLSIKTKLPLGELQTPEKEKLANLETILHKRIVGQDNAISKVAQALLRKRAGVEVKSSPIGTFLFLGPTGVGKTETAKALAEAYFASEEKMIRLDMSEFQNDKDVVKLIGDNDAPGILTSQIRQNPFTVLLLDEFEKANSKILNIFLTVFDEGYITDGLGKKVSFKNAFIIAASNAGSEFIREKVLGNTQNQILEKELTEYLLKEKIFSPELLNRFDAVIFFKPLTKLELEKIAYLMLEKLNKKLEEEKGITIAVNSNVITKLVEKGYDPAFGARNLQRTIQEEIENQVANKILDGSAPKGSQIEINL